MSTKLKVIGLGDNGCGLRRDQYIRYAESMLFSAPSDEEIDYVRLDVETPFYDPVYERAIRKKNLNLIYFLDDIRQHLDLPSSQCIDILIDIERRLSRSQMVGAVHHIVDLDRDVRFLSDLLQAEYTFLQTKLLAEDYLALSEKVPHLGVPGDLASYLQELKRLSEVFHGDADHLTECRAS
jgi:hypothetical protein